LAERVTQSVDGSINVHVVEAEALVSATVDA
jgi:hypothetical protein